TDGGVLMKNHYDGHSNMNQMSERRAAAERRDNYSRRWAKTTPQSVIWQPPCGDALQGMVA
ncbi:Dynein heavy chain 11 axonemal, partial [Dissostichus eleginoides]